MKNNDYAFGYSIDSKKLLLINLIKPYKKKLLFGMLFLALTNLNNAILPRLVNKGVSFIQDQKNITLDFGLIKFNLGMLNQLLFLLVILAVLGAFIRTLSRIFIFDLGRNVEKDIMSKLYQHLVLQDDKFYKVYGVGDLMNHLITDTANIRMMAGFSLLSVINILFLCVISIPLLFSINVTLALTALLPFLCIIIVTKILSAKIFANTKKHQEQLSFLSSHLQENLLLSQLIRLFHRQEYEASRFEETNNNVSLSALSLGNTRVLMNPIMRLITGFSVGLVLLVGLFLIATNQITLGAFIEVNARILQLSWPFTSVGFVISSYSRGMASLNRINKLLENKPDILDGNIKIDNISKITINNLDFSDTKKHRKKINLSIKNNQTVGIVGANASFKSSLLRVIYRRAQVSEGVVFFDGHDINSLTLDCINNLMAVVTQEPFLFHASIKDNLCFGAQQINENELDSVLKLVSFSKEVANFPKGLETIIGERGITLSGGQKQRIAIGRAILSKRPILILDDALSACDAQTENHIMSNLLKIKHIKIKIIVTHKLSLTKDADEIFVMDNGEIVDHGNHDHLINNCLVYKEFWGMNEKY